MNVVVMYSKLRSTILFIHHCYMKNIIQKLLWTEILALILLWLLIYPQEYRYVDIIRWIAAFLYILYIPGYWVSYFFFTEDEVGVFERWMMSFALSLLMISLITFYLHYFQIPVYHIYIYVSILLVICIAFVYLITRKKT